MARLVGSNLDDAFAGLWQDDQLYGRGGNDYLTGGDGNDRVYGDAGRDTIYGENGADALRGGGGDDTVVGNFGDDRIWGDDGNDFLMDYDGAGNVMAGGRGDDYLLGQGHMLGQDGNDTLEFAGGDGVLEGGRGADLLVADLFQYGFDQPAQRVAITDFNPAQGDHLSLNAIDPYGNYIGFGDKMQPFNMWDSNHDNQLTGDDLYVDPDAAGDGLDLHFWNMTLDVGHTPVITADFLL
jgi:Ca2+-binding RTX toxin-like protein